MLFEALYVRVKYNKGYYDFTDIIADFSLSFFAFVLIISGQAISICLLKADMQLFSLLKKKLNYVFKAELAVGCAIILIYELQKAVNSVPTYYEHEFLQSLVLGVDYFNSVTLITASVISQIILTALSKL